MIKSWGCIVATCALFAAACGSSSAGGGQGTIRIGVPEPLSGSLALTGVEGENAARLAVSDVNKAGGVLGSQVEIVVEDDQCDSQVAVQAAEKLVTEGIVGIAGGYCSGSSIPESDVLRRHGDLPFIAPAASNPKLTEQGYDNVFRINVRDDFEGPLDASYLYDYLKARRVAIMGDNSTFSKGLSDLVRQALTSKSDAKVVYFDTITPGQSDYTSPLSAVAASQPDALYFTGYYPEYALLIKQWKRAGYSFKMVAGAGAFDDGFLKLAPVEDPNVTITSPLLGDFLPGQAKIASAYRAMFGVGPGAVAALEYDAIQLMVKGIRDANSTKAGDINRALHAIKGYDGLTGSVTFDSHGDRGAFPFMATTVTGGKFVLSAKNNDGKTWEQA